jgi:hypothetical protein
MAAKKKLPPSTNKQQQQLSAASHSTIKIIMHIILETFASSRNYGCTTTNS